MKKVLLFFSIVLFFACSKDEFLVTDFYVKNTSNKTISFDASILKRSSDGYHELSLPFVVYANDSVLARRTEFSKDGKNPHKWFRKFIIHPVEGIEMNDPNLPENWIKYNTNGNPVYVFTLNKN
jgi:hypothetical protein